MTKSVFQKLTKSLSYLLLFFIFFNGAEKPVIIPDHVRTIVVYYLPSTVHLEVPATKATIFSDSDHAIVIENKMQRERFVELMLKAILELDKDDHYVKGSSLLLTYGRLSGNLPFMSRPLRVEIPDGWYHVMNRGLRRH